ncbi:MULTISPECIES: DUF4297 family anti-phage-associated protein [Rhodanobacter]|uniref:DUF4297 family anti-phage-associated protein n=1 Tax=Rhodanobacter TaxID=75309 RepID=UPI0003F89492|nr:MULTISPECIES: DUF4297 family anti-phage-associated protein [Rhodanobacter]KZC20960.1 hypothetical protein RHOFW104R3_22715 [Rhodanobacter denitrificans]UJJ52658.1 hypothetical protein LRK52_08265 [Rhodanobacter denitrificans]UJM95411.1 hypothetical protein LRK32_08305 [Rhodanobacter denitrificans]UJM98942.1 hypothetical protein LRK44_08310 [Rhodanobacter denitrificans]UJN21643.1 hypothetical protein LRK54_00190 [Rhodanobacter denitrificans]
MTDRSATATIKGYFYQFDQTIVRLLGASKHASVTVEGIEDIDLDDDGGSAFVQCKYYEGTEYNHSVIKEAVIHMLRHFHAQGCPTNQIYRYRLYGHYKSGQHKLVLPLTDEFLKDNFLTYTREKVEHKVHEELKMTAPQFEAFRDLLDIDVNALSYEDQQKELVRLLISEIPGCSAADAEVFYYPSAINVVQSLAVEAEEAKRRITRERFLKEVDRKEIIFSSWLQQKFGADYYAKSIRRKYFKFNATKMPKASRIFVIDVEGEYDALKAQRMLVSLGDFFSHKELARTTPQDRFSPYVLLRSAAPSELLELKRSLWKQGVKFLDGYPFLGADFSTTLLAADPTRENLWRIKFIPAEDQLASIIAAITGSVIEIYDLYKTAPLDDAFVPKGYAHHAIKCGSSYFIQEVMNA